MWFDDDKYEFSRGFKKKSDIHPLDDPLESRSIDYKPNIHVIISVNDRERSDLKGGVGVRAWVPTTPQPAQR